MSAPRLALAARYVAWLRRWSAAVIAVALLVSLVAAALVAFRLPLYADFSHLLPPDAPAVRDLRRLEARVSAQDTLLVLVVARDPAARAAAATELAAQLRALPSTMVGRVDDDDDVTRGFLRDHKFLFVPLADLEAARAALSTKLRAAKLEANPLFIDLDEPTEAERAASAAELDQLRAKQRDAEATLARSSFISADGLTQLLVVRTAFAKTDVDASARMMAALGRVRADVLTRHPVEIGFAGGPVVSLAEHTALVRGIVWSTIITALLVALVLALYLRSVRLVALLGGVVVAATTISFGLAVFTVGHLNAATAFLGAIIAGNGVNYGVLLVARFRDERQHHDADTAMARAIAGTLRPTLVASLGAAIAYGSLAATSFQGFADFAMIGAVGMLVCWLASYTALPAAVLRLDVGPTPAAGAALGRVLVRLVGFRSAGRVLVVAALAVVGMAVVTYRYIAHDPFEYDLTQLRSAGADATAARSWMARSDAAFGRGIAGQTYIATDDLAEVRAVVAALARVDRPGQPPTIGKVRSILDVLPDDQPAKLAVLSELRTLLDDDALEALSDADRAELVALRPPDGLAAITADGLPAPLLENLREPDGRIGLLVGVRPHPTLDEWDGRDLVRFATAVRRLELADGRTVTTSGSSVIFADILAAIRDDGPKVTGLAALGLVVMVLLVIGVNARATAVLVAVAVGALGLVTVCAALGLRVNFLDFVALPITLGLGVDYAINIAERQAETDDLDATLASAGGAVFVCSLTTVIGYGSLLVSDNLAIRGFGLASLIGELAALAAALVLVPAIMIWAGRRSAVPRG